MPLEVRCPNCGDGVYEESHFCPHCGVLRPPADSPVCAEHAERVADRVCIICQRLLCSSCVRRKRGRSFCTDHRKIEVVLDWANVYQSSDVAEAELMVSVLDAEGFTVQKQNFDSGGVIWGTAVARPAKVFVPIPEYLRAHDIVVDWASQFGSRPSQDEAQESE